MGCPPCCGADPRNWTAGGAVYVGSAGGASDLPPVKRPASDDTNGRRLKPPPSVLAAVLATLARNRRRPSAVLCRRVLRHSLCILRHRLGLLLRQPAQLLELPGDCRHAVGETWRHRRNCVLHRLAQRRGPAACSRHRQSVRNDSLCITHPSCSSPLPFPAPASKRIQLTRGQPLVISPARQLPRVVLLDPSHALRRDQRFWATCRDRALSRPNRPLGSVSCPRQEAAAPLASPGRPLCMFRTSTRPGLRTESGRRESVFSFGLGQPALGLDRGHDLPAQVLGPCGRQRLGRRLLPVDVQARIPRRAPTPGTPGPPPPPAARLRASPSGRCLPPETRSSGFAPTDAASDPRAGPGTSCGW